MSARATSDYYAYVKLFRFLAGAPDASSPWPLAFQDRALPGVVLADGRHLDVSASGLRYRDRFFDQGFRVLEAWLAEHESECPVLDPASIHFCEAIEPPSKLICVGLNYRDHAAEMGSAIPTEPVLFMKATTALSGVSDPVVLLPGSEHLDYEIEVALVIGQLARNISVERAMEAVFGFCMMNDYSEREFQKNRGGQWVKGKSGDTMAPLGPYVVPRAEVNLPLELELKVNGTLRQRQSTASMIFGFAEIVSRVSGYMTLLPGDVISTGTPSGVGMGMKPAQYLKAADLVEYSVSGLGSARQLVSAAPAQPAAPANGK